MVLPPDSEGIGALVEDRDRNAEIHLGHAFVRRKKRMITTAVRNFRDQINVMWNEAGK